MRKLFAAFLLLTGLASAAAQVPNFPQTLPANSVVGRLGVSSGPAQAIPFSTLATQLTTGTVFNVKTFGASGTNCVTDDTAAISAAITAAQAVATTQGSTKAGGGAVYFPRGQYRISSRLASTVPIAFIGDGRFDSIICVDTAGGGLAMNPTASSDAWLIKDLGFKAVVANAGTAIAFTGVVTASNNFPNLQIQNVHIWRDGGNFFLNGISVSNCWHCTISDTLILGASAVANWMPIGIELGTKTIDARIENVYIYGAQNAVQVTGATVESARISKSSFVAVKNGVVATTAGPIHIDVEDNHIAAANRCVAITGAGQNFIHGNLLYLGDTGGATTSNGDYCIKVDTGNGSIITSNQVIRQSTAATTNGIGVVSTTLFLIDNNVVSGFNTGIESGSGNTLGKIGQNTFFGILTTEQTESSGCGNVPWLTDGPNQGQTMCLGADVAAQKLWLYRLVNDRYGFGIQANELRVFAPSTGHVSIGTISSADGSTWAEKLRVNNDGSATMMGASSILSGGTGTGSSLTLQSTTGSGATDFIAFKIASQSEAMRILTTKQVSVGHTASITLANSQTALLQTVGDATNIPNQAVARFSNDAIGPQVVFAKSKNATIGSHTVVAQNDVIGTLSFQGSDGSAFASMVRIRALADAATLGSGDMPGRFDIATVPDASGSLRRRLIIFNDGGHMIGAGGTSDATETSPGAGVLKLEGTTDATSGTTGILQIAGGVGVAKALWTGTYIATTPLTVGTLPACGAGTKGARSFVTDGNTANAFRGAVTAGGANQQWVVCDGTNWLQG